jgi:hypothetical protein
MSNDYLELLDNLWLHLQSLERRFPSSRARSSDLTIVVGNITHMHFLPLADLVALS